MGKYRIASFVAFVALFFSGCNDDGIIALNADAPILLNYSAKDSRLSFGYVKKESAKKPFALVFIAKDCGNCDEQIKVINEILKEREFDFLAVLNSVPNIELAKEIADEKRVKIPVIYDDESVEYLNNIVGGITGVPAIFFYDKDGKMSTKFLGLVPKNRILEQIRQLDY